MNEQDEGIVIDIRKYSNTSLIVKIFSKNHGKVASLLKGGNSGKFKISIGAVVLFKISKRLEEHLGLLKFETIKAFGLLHLKDRFKNLAISTIREVLFFLTEDGAIEGEIYELSMRFLEFVNSSENRLEILKEYALFELEMLSLLGFGLDFEVCAITGKNDNLFFISPVSGKCAGFEAGKEFKDKLFELPLIYGNLEGEKDLKKDLQNAFKINSHFFSRIPKFEKIISREMLLKLL